MKRKGKILRLIQRKKKRDELDKKLLNTAFGLCEDINNRKVKGTLGLLEYEDGSIGIIRGGTALDKPEKYQGSLTELMMENAVYPNQFYIMKRK